MTQLPTLILSHESALAYWRRSAAIMPAQPMNASQCARALEDARQSMHVKTLQELQVTAALGELSFPLELLTDDRNDRRTTARAHFNCVSVGLPDASLVPAFPKLPQAFVSTPEFCLVQMAHKLPLYDLVFLAYELCGSFALCPDAPRGYIARKSVSTPERLRAFVESVHDMAGAKKARLAASWVLAGARSPSEAQIAMLAHLPRSQGGMGAKPPLLGQSIEAPDPVARIIGSRALTPALIWPDAHVAVEFDNRNWLGSQDRAGFDALMRNAYRMMGISAVPLSRADYEDSHAMRKHFDFINRKCKKRLNPANERQKHMQEQLLAWLAQW